ncbi:hypothetical protein MMC13_000878 [Lambiella insularis]|nr:hypothetical protein [Lambiella insularis]
MSASRGVRIEASERACLECRNRKTRCIIRANNDTCAYCFKKSKECIFSERPERTSLTRKNLDAAESRCRELQSIIQQRSEQPGSRWDLNDPDALSTPSQLASGEACDRKESRPLHEVDIPTGRSNEWHEQSSLELPTSQDGMASLALPSKDSGYLGSTSGSWLLRSLSTYLSQDKNTTWEPPQNEGRGSSDLARSSIQFTNIVSSSQIGIFAARDHYVNAYFIAYNSSYPIVHERTFREQCVQKAQMPQNDIWHVVYFMVLAIGEWVSGDATEHQSLYYEAAHSRLNFGILESGSMSIVQALLLLGNYLQKRDKPNTAYNVIGLAYRVALGVGLHRELPSGSGICAFALQQRRLLFWTLYSFDSGFSMTTGRPTLVSDTFIDIRKPVNVIDTSADASIEVLSEVNYPTTYSAIIAQARLAVIANKVYSNFLSVHACADVDDLVATMEQTIQNWRRSLPSFFFAPDVPQWFRGPRQVILWKEANLQIALLLASQRNHVDDEDKMSISTKCQAVALSTILNISQFCLEHIELVHVGLSWYAVYFLLHAFLALGLHQLFKAKSNKSWPQAHGHAHLLEFPESAISKARECLEMLGRTNKAALRTLQILDRIQDTLGGPISHGNGSSYSTEQHQPEIPHANSRVVAGSPSQSLPSMSDVSQNANRFVTVANDQGATTERAFLGTSPEGGYADYVMNEWVGTADPSLHFFFDNGIAELGNVFEGMQGFPNVLDADSFGYTTSTMHSVRVPEHNQHNIGTNGR